MIKKIISICIFIIIISYTSVTIAKGAHATSHSTVHSTSHSTKSHSSATTHSSSSSKSTINNYKTFTPKYNQSNIKTETVNSNPSNYTRYSTSNFFRPNIWTAMWAFNCMNNNNNKATEQDIAKELEERGYNEQEVNDIIEEGKKAQKEDNDKAKWVIGIIGFVTILLAILFIFILRI